MLVGPVLEWLLQVVSSGRDWCCWGEWRGVVAAREGLAGLSQRGGLVGLLRQQGMLVAG